MSMIRLGKLPHCPWVGRFVLNRKAPRHAQKARWVLRSPRLADNPYGIFPAKLARPAAKGSVLPRALGLSVETVAVFVVRYWRAKSNR